MVCIQYAELLEEGNTRRRVGEDYVFTGESPLKANPTARWNRLCHKVDEIRITPCAPCEC